MAPAIAAPLPLRPVAGVYIFDTLPNACIVRTLRNNDYLVLQMERRCRGAATSIKIVERYGAIQLLAADDANCLTVAPAVEYAQSRFHVASLRPCYDTPTQKFSIDLEQSSGKYIISTVTPLGRRCIAADYVTLGDLRATECSEMPDQRFQLLRRN